ncbi:alpha/beta hydrolase [Bacillus pacificus]
MPANIKSVSKNHQSKSNKKCWNSKKTPMNTLKALQQLIADVRNNVDMIYAPTFVVQARHDEMINTDSANIIYNGVESTLKDIKWYEDSTHVITLDKQRDELHEDVYNFLEQLDW